MIAWHAARRPQAELLLPQYILESVGAQFCHVSRLPRQGGGDPNGNSIVTDVPEKCCVLIQATPHNSARANPEKIWVLMKAFFCRNTLCISRKSDKIRARIYQSRLRISSRKTKDLAKNARGPALIRAADKSDFSVAIFSRTWYALVCNNRQYPHMKGEQQWKTIAVPSEAISAF